ncbi:MAG TPA: tRNA (adenosine(37)-N6)-dimethylallyltransferase MiaA [Flavilitoribacter sp.]|nr:tRNA (adenosine(37)-N6)-dimethylallyltransferase MiaA [Flavilitoribacter sp.]
MKNHLIVIAGPTASGKTRFAIRLAQHYDTAILSADSRQFFKETSIGTAKPNEEELAAARHFFIGNLGVKEHYSVGMFEKEALDLVQELYMAKDKLILVGGSGLYIKAVSEGLDEFPDMPLDVREEVEAKLKKEGIEALQEELKKLDPVYYEEVDLSNPARLVRAIAVSRASGQPFSSFRVKTPVVRDFEPIYIQLQLPREELYRRVNARVDAMVAGGLVEEARSLYELREFNALQTVGYQELFDHFDGNCTLEEAIQNIKQNSRRFAKRQLSWFRRDPYWKWFDPDETDLAQEYIDQCAALGIRFSKALDEGSQQKALEFIESRIGSVERDPRGEIWTVLQGDEVVAAAQWGQRRDKAAMQDFYLLSHFVNTLSEAGFWIAHQAVMQAEGMPIQAHCRPGQGKFFTRLDFDMMPYGTTIANLDKPMILIRNV